METMRKFYKFLKINWYHFRNTQKSEKNSQKFLSNMEKTLKFGSNCLKSEKEFVENFTKIFRNIKVSGFKKISGKYKEIR